MEQNVELWPPVMQQSFLLRAKMDSQIFINRPACVISQKCLPLSLALLCAKDHKSKSCCGGIALSLLVYNQRSLFVSSMAEEGVILCQSL